jgi:DNA-binding MarR family transcriptional regulator
MDLIDSKDVSLILGGMLALGRRLRAERPTRGANLSSLSIMSTLKRLGPMAATRLAQEERLQPQSLTRILQALEKDGTITRQRSASDRREIILELTLQGEAMLGDDLRARRDWLEHAIADVLNATERQALMDAAPVMQKLARKVQGSGAEPLASPE